MTGADILVKCLEEEKVEYVFGYPGVAICPFYDSILNTDIKTILVREEQNAAHAASGYARITGKVGVVAVTSGPGALNTITGIATAFADSIPMVCITGQVDSRLMGSDVFQEADISGACESFVKYSYIARKASDIPRIMKEAFHIANTGRKGPVLIDVPIDIQEAAVNRFSYPESVQIRSYKPTVKGNALQIKKTLKEFEKAKRPVICIGGGVHLAGAAEEVRAFAEKNHIPTVCTMMGLGVMPSNHWLFFGMVGNNGQKYANRAMNEADLVLVAGARVADRSFKRPDMITDNKVLIHIDVDPAEIGKNAGASIPLVGDIENVFEVLASEPLEANYEDWIADLTEYKTEGRELDVSRLADGVHVREGSTVTPAHFVRMLSLQMQEDAIYVADVGQNQLWSCKNYVARKGRLLTSGGMGTMGYSIPAGMGAKMYAPDKQVVCVIGDGAFQMSMNELATIKDHSVPLKILIIKNRYLGLVREYQDKTYEGHHSGVELFDYPHYDKIAEAYDMPYFHAGTTDELDKVLDGFLKCSEACLMVCDVDSKDNSK